MSASLSLSEPPLILLFPGYGAGHVVMLFIPDEEQFAAVSQ